MPAAANPSPPAPEPVADPLAETGPLTAVPAAAGPTTPADETPATATDAPADTGWFQPAVPSAVPYEFPSTGSVRLLPGRGPGAPHGAAGASSPARFRTAPPGTAAPAARETGGAAVPATPPVAPATPPATAARPPAAPAPASAPRAAPRPAAVPPAALPPSIVIPAGPGSPGTAPTGAAPGTADAGTAIPATPVPRLARGDLFGRHTRSYAAENSGQQITILQAGCTTAEELGAAALRAAGARLSVSMIDEGSEVTRAAVARHRHLADAILGDMRTVTLPPRAYDIVQCSLLLDRIEHAELVLDRLTGAVKPGGLLLLRIRDRDSAAGFLDRVLPGPARQFIWRKRQPGEPGPHMPVYERLASARGVQAYALLHGLVITERGALGGMAGGLPRGPYGYLAAQQLAAWLSRGRLTSAHEDLLYVIRKPQDRFARIL